MIGYIAAGVLMLITPIAWIVVRLDRAIGERRLARDRAATREILDRLGESD